VPDPHQVQPPPPAQFPGEDPPDASPRIRAWVVHDPVIGTIHAVVRLNLAAPNPFHRVVLKRRARYSGLVRLASPRRSHRCRIRDPRRSVGREVQPIASQMKGPPLNSFGWTSSRAKRMYFVWHAPLEEMLEHFGIEPIPDAPPANLDSAE